MTPRDDGMKHRRARFTRNPHPLRRGGKPPSVVEMQDKNTLLQKEKVSRRGLSAGILGIPIGPSTLAGAVTSEITFAYRSFPWSCFFRPG
jgi:hypothetical protein